MQVTYKGASEAVTFDGVEFPQGQAVEYTGSRGEKLKANRFFEVTEDDGKKDEGGPKPVEKMTKAELLAHAKEAFGVDLDGSKSKGDVLKEVQELAANGDSD